jgi:hypothetical protein
MSKGTDMWERFGSSVVVGAVVGALAFVASCRPVFHVELFTVTGQGADYPIMLSQTPAGAAGRKIEASSGTRMSQLGGTRSSYTEHVQSEMPAWMKLNVQVLRKDKWMQIERVELYARDFTTLNGASTVRKLAIEGTVYQ